MKESADAADRAFTVNAHVAISPWDTWLTASLHRPEFDDLRVDCSCGWHFTAKDDDTRWDVWIAHVIAEHMIAMVGASGYARSDLQNLERSHIEWAINHG